MCNYAQKYLNLCFYLLFVSFAYIISDITMNSGLYLSQSQKIISIPYRRKCPIFIANIKRPQPDTDVCFGADFHCFLD